MKETKCAVALCAVLLLRPVCLIGGTVNLDIQASGDPTYSGGDGVLSGGGTFWNNSYSNSLNLSDESGGATAIDVVLRQWLGSVSHSGSHVLFGDGLTVSASSAVIYDILDLDPYKTYDVAVYYQSSYGDAYLVHRAGVLHITASVYNNRALPGTEGGEYLLFTNLTPYEISAGQWGVKVYAYGANNAMAGLQIKNTGVTNNIPPYMPTLVSPTNGTTAASITPTLAASSFSDSDGGDTHANSRWQVDNNSDFSSPEWDSGDSYTATTSAVVPGGVLAYGTRYYWRVRYKDSKGNWSSYSSSWSFTTVAQNSTTTYQSTTTYRSSTTTYSPVTTTYQSTTTYRSSTTTYNPVTTTYQSTTTYSPVTTTYRSSTTTYLGAAWDSGYQDLGGGWRRLSWFGDYIPMGSAGWIWHNKHGFYYVPPSSTPQSVFLYAQDMGWLWTSSTTYPYLYRFSDGAWLWYNGATGPRWFLNMSTSNWESW